MEDAGMPTAIVMPPLSEDEDGEDSMHSRDNQETERYSPMPTSPNNEPLLQQDDPSFDHPREGPQLPEDQRPRRSLETLNSSEEASSLMRVDTPAYDDPRGEAPAYFEAVDLSEEVAQYTATTTIPSPPPVSALGSPNTAPQRRSGFRTLLNSLPNRISKHGASQPSHTRADSSLSIGSSDISHGREASRSRASHRPTPSGSGSLLSLSPFRTISRQKSSNTLNLNSPSLISLNSISAPLTHTVVRTEFTYPKAGPTPEQLKLISSRESFARFGMPYGADAIAYAASASRQELDVPPPDFDVAGSGIQQIPGSAGPSRLRTTSNAADLQRAAVDDAGSSSESEAEPSSANNDIPPVNENTPPSLMTSPPSPGPRPSSLEPSEPEAPPTSFRAPSTFERSESRASSMQSYATAAESMMVPHTPMDSESIESQPTTPRLGGQHVLELTDVTITQTPVTKA
jgi:hypothetical protein